MTIQEFGESLTPPSGTIALWHEPLSEIPSGWVLCDGNNGTPNMLDKFPRGVSSGEDPGSTGGQHSHSLSTSQIPSHNHSGSTDNAGGHNHSFWTNLRNSDDGNDDSFTSDPDALKFTGGGGSQSTTGDGSHSHTASLNNTGGGASIDNRPAYREVAYIMKV